MVDGMTKSCAVALHDWIAFGWMGHTQSVPAPTRRKQIDAMEERGFIDRNGPTEAGRKWVSEHLTEIIFA